MKQIYAIYCDCAKDCRTTVDKCLLCDYSTVIKTENRSENNKSLGDY